MTKFSSFGKIIKLQYNEFIKIPGCIMLNRAVQMSPPAPYDRWLLMVVGILMSLGLVMVASASIVISDKMLNQPFYYLYRQMISIVLGVLAGSIVVQFKISTWEKLGGLLLVGVMLLLAMVLLPGIGHSVNGSSRWIGFGPLRIQVSELAKLAAVIYLAGYLFRRNVEIRTHLT
jgi:cell division protein FtsW